MAHSTLPPVRTPSWLGLLRLIFESDHVRRAVVCWALTRSERVVARMRNPCPPPTCLTRVVKSDLFNNRLVSAEVGVFKIKNSWGW